MTITRARLFAGLAAVAVIGLTAPASAAPERMRADDVTSVTTPEARFVLAPGGRWNEVGRGGNASFTFEETGREGGKVMLLDRSRGVRLQLDLDSKQVLYSDDAAPKPVMLYAITDASTVVNSMNVVRVQAEGSSFVWTGPGRWEERGDGVYQFTEQRREEWAVLLEDRSRGVKVRLELGHRQVTYADSGEPRFRPLYTITSASAR